MLGPRRCAQAFFSCGEWGPLLIAVCGLLIVVASCCGAWALGMQASVVVARGPTSSGLRALELRLSSCSARAQSLRGMWHLPRPGLEPMSPAPAGRLNHCATREALQLFLSFFFYKQIFIFNYY